MPIKRSIIDNILQDEAELTGRDYEWLDKSTILLKTTDPTKIDSAEFFLRMKGQKPELKKTSKGKTITIEAVTEGLRKIPSLELFTEQMSWNTVPTFAKWNFNPAYPHYAEYNFEPKEHDGFVYFTGNDDDALFKISLKDLTKEVHGSLKVDLESNDIDPADRKHEDTIDISQITYNSSERYVEIATEEIKGLIEAFWKAKKFKARFDKKGTVIIL